MSKNLNQTLAGLMNKESAVTGFVSVCMDRVQHVHRRGTQLQHVHNVAIACMCIGTQTCTLGM